MPDAEAYDVVDFVSTIGEAMKHAINYFAWEDSQPGGTDIFSAPALGDWRGMRALYQIRVIDGETVTTITNWVVISTMALESIPTLRDVLLSPGWNTRIRYSVPEGGGFVDEDDFSAWVTTWHTLRELIITSWVGGVVTDAVTGHTASTDPVVHCYIRFSTSGEGMTGMPLLTTGDFVDFTAKPELDIWNEFAVSEQSMEAGVSVLQVATIGADGVAEITQELRNIASRDVEYQVGRKGEIAYLRSKGVVTPV